MAIEPFIFLAVVGISFIALMRMRKIAIQKKPRRSTYIAPVK